MGGLRILAAGGGSGGHLVPGLALARRLRARGHAVRLLVEGRAVEDAFLGAGTPETRRLPVAGRGLGAFLRFVRAAGAAAGELASFRPDLVVGLGGRGAAAVLFPARRRGLPYVLLEQNAVPGRATRRFASGALRVFVAFPEAAARLRGARIRTTGMPLREDLGLSPSPKLAEELGLPPGRPVLLVVGGSQGAQSLNLLLPRWFAGVPGIRDWSILHLSGRGKEEDCAEAYAATGLDAHVLPFRHDLPALYALAALVVCRGGGTTLHELAAAGRPALVVPYPWHRDRHQEANARAFEAAGAARVLAQEALARGEGRAVLAELLADPARRRRMGEAARRALPLGGAERIVREIETLAGARAEGA